MLKSIQLKLAKVKYSGDSIGDDIRIEIEIMGKFLTVDKTIKVGATKEIGQEIGKFETDRTVFQAEVQVAVIEKDILFNDVGRVKKDIKINTSSHKAQQFSFPVQITETHSSSGKSWGKKIAIFEMILEAKVSDAILYISFEKGRGGWTQVKLENKDTEVALPAYLKVKLDSQDSKRQYFTILEGPWRGEKASVKLNTDGSSYLEPTNRQTGPAHLIYYRSKNLLKYKNQTYETLDYKDDPDPWQKKLYDIKIPDHSHKGGQYYLDRAGLAMVWFKTTHRSDDRYIHPGSYTLGCVTLTEIERWDELCKTLMKARKGDGEGIGFLEVVL